MLIMVAIRKGIDLVMGTCGCHRWAALLLLASLTRSEQRRVSQRVTPKPKKLITFDRISPPNQFRQIDNARSLAKFPF